jgi:hypothetical protein
MESNALPIGADIYTSDGDRLGKVKEVRGAYFKVDAPMHTDYWLGTECIRGGSSGGRVTVVFDKDHVEDYKQSVDDR